MNYNRAVSRQKLDLILENNVLEIEVVKNVNNKKCAPTLPADLFGVMGHFT